MASRSFNEQPGNNFRVGDKASHQKWGEGLIVEVKPGDTVIKVAFSKQGIKSLDTCFAPLKLLE